jgi:hypothetical protein
MSPVPKSGPDAAREPIGTDANTTPPNETPTDAQPGRAGSGPGQPNFSGPSGSGQKGTPEEEAANRRAARANVGEAVKQATENLKREVDAIRSQIAQGDMISVAQIDALKASIDGIAATVQTLPAVGEAEPKR